MSIEIVYNANGKALQALIEEIFTQKIKKVVIQNQERKKENE